ncbi:MAG: hypothetical protein J0M12_10840 [Deltaproteobacteria bacterium]|nr:hypothetical protein [Deltaproteobacteria bacterium]
MWNFARRNDQHGFSLLEQAMVLPITLMIVAGALDINSLLQGYTALKEGVNASLRCVYTTDGKCVSTSPDLRPRLFNYYRVTRHPEYLVDTFDFKGTASWINKPNYRFSNFQAQVLGGVTYEAQSANVSVVRRYFPAQRVGSYTVQSASMPYITGSGRNPNTKFRGAPASEPAAPLGNYPFTALPLGSVHLVSSGSDSQTTFSFTLREANTNVVKSAMYERPSTQNENISDFSALSNPLETRVALHITGEKSDTTVGSLGGIAIQLEYFDPQVQRWIHKQDLGGQQLGRSPGESADANFVIRGLDPEFIGPGAGDYSELHSYNMTLRYGGRYRIRFLLHAQAGTVGWQGKQLKIFYPVEESRQSIFECQGGMLPCGSPESCQTAAPAALFQGEPLIHTEASPLRYESPILLESCSTGVANMDELLSSHSINECADNFELRTEQSGCSVQTATRACPAIGTAKHGAPNYGVPQTPGMDGLIHASAQAASICPAPSEGLIGLPQNVRWSVTSATVPAQHVRPGSDGSFIATKESCSATIAWPDDSTLSSYPHVTYAQVMEGQSPHYTGNENPIEVKNNPAFDFSCNEFPVTSSPIDVLPEQGTPSNQNSLFNGSHVKPACDLHESLKEDAVRYSLMPSAAYFEAQPPILMGDKSLSVEMPAACIDPNPEVTWSEPDRRELVAGGPFIETTLPIECSEAGASCAAEFAGFGEGKRGSTSYDFERAAQYFGYNEIQARYPRARWNCGEKDCATIEVIRDGTSMRAQGSLRVPLYVLGNNEIELRYTNQERREAEFSR